MVTRHPTKVCSKCHAEKPVDAFGVESRQKDGRRAHCRTCGWAATKEYRQRSESHKRSVQKWRRGANGRAYQRRGMLKSNYGITQDGYDRMLTEQGGVCAICGTTNPGGRYGCLVVDHNHATGKVRGLLCDRCNKGAGFFNDDPELLDKAVAYLRGKETASHG